MYIILYSHYENINYKLGDIKQSQHPKNSTSQGLLSRFWNSWIPPGAVRQIRAIQSSTQLTTSWLETANLNLNPLND